jgi:uncharacterized protein involved in type VI secretion and phage assembly
MTNLFDALLGSEAAARPALLPGVVVGIVTNIQDPEGLGRVKVQFPWLSDRDESFWARVVTPMAGKNRGICFLPEVNDEVLVAFAQGDLGSPYVLGGMWNAQDSLPKDGDPKNDVRVIKSRSGHVIRLIDQADAEKIEIVDRSNQNKLVFDTASNTITLESAKDITLSAPQGTITLKAQTIELASSAETTMKASATMTLEGTTINLN